MIDLGKRLRALRKQKHLTQSQVALRAGVSKAMISAYELSVRCPSYDVLINLASIFGVSTDYLLGVNKNRYLSINDLSDKQIELINCLIKEFIKE